MIPSALDPDGALGLDFGADCVVALAGGDDFELVGGAGEVVEAEDMAVAEAGEGDF